MVKVLTTADPSFGQVSRQMNKILEQLQKGYSNFYPSDTWNPAVNLYETDEAYHVCVDLSGVEKDKIDLTIVGQRLILKGLVVPVCPETQMTSDDAESHGSKRLRVHVMEIDHGSFSREVASPIRRSREDSRQVRRWHALDPPPEDLRRVARRRPMAFCQRVPDGLLLRNGRNPNHRTVTNATTIAPAPTGSADDSERPADPADPQHRRLPRHRHAAERRPAEEQDPARRGHARRQADRRRHAAERGRRRPARPTTAHRRRRLHDPQAVQAARRQPVDHRPRADAVPAAGARAGPTRSRSAQIEVLEDDRRRPAGARRAARVGAAAGEPRDRAVAEHAGRGGAGAQQHHATRRRWPTSSPPTSRRTPPRSSRCSKSSTSRSACG